MMHSNNIIGIYTAIIMSIQHKINELRIKTIAVNQHAKVAPRSLYIEDCSCLKLWRHAE